MKDNPRYLIVNADDFGLSRGVNEGIAASIRAGIVTSASLMVNQIGSRQAADVAGDLPDVSLGLHLDLGEWTFRKGRWHPLYEVVPLENKRRVRDEVLRQLDSFRALTGDLPTHVDSHQHVHREPPLRDVLPELLSLLEMPLRFFTPGVRYCGDFYGQTSEGKSLPERISVDALIAAFDSLRPGVTELACHPGWDEQLHTMYCRERRREVEALCDERVREALVSRQIELISFLDLDRVGESTPAAFENGGS